MLILQWRLIGSRPSIPKTLQRDFAFAGSYHLLAMWRVDTALPQQLSQPEVLHFCITTRLNSRCFRCVYLQNCGLCFGGANWSIKGSETRRPVESFIQQVWPFKARLAPLAGLFFYIMWRRFWPFAAVPRNDQSGLKGIFPPKMPFHALFKETSWWRIGKHAAVGEPACDQFHGQPDCFGHRLKC